jgi:hypothetical protein
MSVLDRMDVRLREIPPTAWTEIDALPDLELARERERALRA